MKKRRHRLCIYPKDIQLITGRSICYSRNLLNTLRLQLGKGKKDFVTIEEFCTLMGINYESVVDMIGD